MAKTIEVKYGQDHASKIREAILAGLPWDGLTPEKLLEFFKTLKVYTQRADYRFVDTHFKIIGSPLPKGEPGAGHHDVFRLYDVAFRRSRAKDADIPNDCVLFEAYIYEETEVRVDRIWPVFHAIASAGTEHCSAVVMEDFNLRVQALMRKTEDYSLYLEHVFGFGNHFTNNKYVHSET